MGLSKKLDDVTISKTVDYDVITINTPILPYMQRHFNQQMYYINNMILVLENQ
jgi:hypothetical protein